MQQATLIHQAIYLILIQIISSHSEYVRNDSFMTNYNTTIPAESWQSGRSKRSIYNIMPELLKMNIQYDGGPIIKATMTKQTPILANKYLPVIGNQINPFTNVMDDVGEFVMYQDINNCIAIVYFEKLGTFHGVVGLNHHITDLPLNIDINGIYQSQLVGNPYVSENFIESLHINPNENIPPPSDTEAWQDFLRPFDIALDEIQRLFTLGQQPSTSRQLNEQDSVLNHKRRRLTPEKKKIIADFWSYRKYYVETLVMITRDFADLFKTSFGEENYIAAIVRYHVVYFNAVNMLLKRLYTFHNEYFEVTINIAKIVIEGGSTSFGFETRDGLQFTDITTKLPQFFRNYADLYTQDSFDYVFVHTSNSIMDRNILVHGISKYGQDMIEGRKTGTFYETIPITIVKLKNYYSHYAIATHEIGRTLGVKITPKENGFQLAGQCHSIMQRNGPQCNICLAWTDENFFQILKYFRENQNRCFLLNLPRSLHSSVVTKMVTPNEQCQCQGYGSYLKTQKGRVRSYVQINDCSKPLRCQIKRENQIFYEDTILPFDGTKCGKKKVCWRGECQEIELNLSMTDEN